MTGEGKRWERLRDYPWSSVQLYCGWKRKRPSWFVVDKVLESYCFKDDTRGRDSYGKYMDAKGEEVQGAEPGIGYEELRRGWCLGDGDFRQKMLDRAKKALEGKKLESVMGDFDYFTLVALFWCFIGHYQLAFLILLKWGFNAHKSITFIGKRNG